MRAMTSAAALDRHRDGEHVIALAARPVGLNVRDAAARSVEQPLGHAFGNTFGARRMRRHDSPARVHDAQVNPMRARQERRPQVRFERRRVVQALGGVRGYRQERLALRVEPAVEHHRRQFRLLFQSLVELLLLPAPHRPEQREPDDEERDDAAHRQCQQSPTYGHNPLRPTAC